jgi:hypothetical protein
MQSMDSEKLGDKSMIGILDPTHVNQASNTVTLIKNSDMYRNMSQGDFDKQVKELTGTTRSKVALCIAKAIQAFAKDGKFLINIPYFLSKFDMYSQFDHEVGIMLSGTYTQTLGQLYFWTPWTHRRINSRISLKFYKSKFLI